MKTPRIQLENVLKNHHLRNTAVRRAVLDLFQHTNHAISHQDVENLLNGAYDRVTIYRTLKSFEEVKLIHKVLNDNDSANYALCRDHCSHEHEGDLPHKDKEAHTHHHNHAHFKCSVCSLTFCLEETLIPKIELPAAYIAQSWQLLIEGVCKNCVS